MLFRRDPKVIPQPREGVLGNGQHLIVPVFVGQVVCSIASGGGILAQQLLGHHTVGAVEIEPYCRTVLLQRQRDLCLPLFPVWDDVTTFRADNLLNIEVDGWDTYMRYELGEAAGMEDVSTMQDIRDAVIKRLDYFAAQGCQIADHALPYMVFAPAKEYELDDVVGKVINGKGVPSKLAMEQYKTAILLFLGEEYARRGWTMQIHYSALRDVNSAQYSILGHDSGFDAVDTHNCAPALAKFLDALNKKGHLPKTIISSLNPADNIVIAALLPAFSGTEALGKIQQGAAWWFNNNKEGIEAQLRILASISVLGNTIGTPTDSRSLLSYSRHEYYRRILCNFIGNLVENGEYPADMKTLGKLVEDISYNNACRYFAF